MPILFVLLIFIIIALMAIPYILLYWWIEPVSAMGYLAVFGLGSIVLLIIVIIIGSIQNHRANRS